MDISASNLDKNSGATYKRIFPSNFLREEPSLSAEQLIEEYRQTQRHLSIPLDLRLPSVDSLFQLISGTGPSNSMKLDSEFNHAYFTKRPKYADAVVYLINARPQLASESGRESLEKLINQQFKANQDLEKILMIPLETPSLTDLLASLKTHSASKLGAAKTIETLKAALNIGTTEKFYPPHKKYYENHIELIMSKLFKTGFKHLERLSSKNIEFFVYNINHNQHLISSVEDASLQSTSGKEILEDLKKRYPKAITLEAKFRADRPVGNDLQIGDYKRFTSKKQDELHLAAFTDNNFYQLRLKGATDEFKSLTNTDFFTDLKSEFDNYLPETNSLRGEKIIEALFSHLNTDVKPMSQNPGHRYDIKVTRKNNALSSLKLLNKGKDELLVEVKSALDDYPSIRSLTVNQATRFNNLKKSQQAIIAKVILNDFDKLSANKSTVEDLFKDYPPRIIVNEEGFTVLKPDLIKSKDAKAPYTKIYLLDYSDLKSSKGSHGDMSSPATISHLNLSFNLKAVQEKILKSKGQEIDLSKVDASLPDLERAAYFTNLKKLKDLELKLKTVNQDKAFREEGFAAIFTQRNSLRDERTGLMQDLLITQLRHNNPFPNLRLREFPSRFNPALRSSFTAANPDINEHVFVFEHKKTGEIKPCEIMFFSEADPALKFTLSHLIERDISALDGSESLPMPIRLAFYDSKTNKIHLFKESLPEKLLNNLAKEFRDLAKVKQGTHYIKDSLFKSLEPVALHIRPERMLEHAFS